MNGTEAVDVRGHATPRLCSAAFKIPRYPQPTPDTRQIALSLREAHSVSRPSAPLAGVFHFGNDSPWHALVA